MSCPINLGENPCIKIVFIIMRLSDLVNSKCIRKYGANIFILFEKFNLLLKFVQLPNIIRVMYGYKLTNCNL